MMSNMMTRLMARQQPMPQQMPGAPVGMAPPQQPFPGGSQAQALQPFMTQGPYGLQALRLAGLLGANGAATAAPGMSPVGPAQRPVGGAAQYQPGLFMPGYRPGIDSPLRGSAGDPRGQFQQY